MNLLLLPGDLVCEWLGVPKSSDHRQILRTFINTIVWGAIAAFVAIKIVL